MTIRVVVVGAGLMGRWHARAALRCGARVVGVFDRDSTAATRLAAAVGGGRTATTGDHFAAILEREDPDAVHICTPLESHVELCQGALEAGAHLLVEKPLAPTSAETLEILQLARERGRVRPVENPMPPASSDSRSSSRISTI